MNYNLLHRVMNMIKLKLWHKSKGRRICLRMFMICCTGCSKITMRDFDGYLCLCIFSDSRGYIRTKYIVPTLNSLTFIHSLNELELGIILGVFNKYYAVSIDRNKRQIAIVPKK